MLNKNVRTLARIIREPRESLSSTTTFSLFDVNRATILVVRTRACVSMKKPTKVIAQVVGEIVQNYPELAWWIVKTEHKHGVAYVNSCVAHCATW